VVMGLNPSQFSWNLKKGESFETPEVLLSCSTGGLAKLTKNFHKTIRENITKGKFKLSSRPVLINNWEATYFNFDEEKIEKIARQAAELGIDMMVLDDGWFGKRDSDLSGLGDWFVNEEKLYGGLAKLIEKINAMGMKFGLWMEPEMVSEDSDLYRAHPEWAIKIPGRDPVRSRYQLVLDFSNPEVVDYLYERISNILSTNHIEYVKWDCNRSISDWYTPTLPANRMKEMPHRYMLGLYNLLQRINDNFPEVMIEGCSGGGGRFDAGMLQYCPQIWCSDNTDAHDRTFIQYGTNFIYPVSAVGSHVSAVPNHQTGRTTSLNTRGVVAMCGSFGYELDLNKISEEEKQVVIKQVARYKDKQPLIYGGDYYRLNDPYESGMAAWEYAAADGTSALIQGVIYRAEVTSLKKRIFPKGLVEDKCYRVTKRMATSPEDIAPESVTDEQSYTGKALMTGGILLDNYKGDDVAFELEIKLK